MLEAPADEDVCEARDSHREEDEENDADAAVVLADDWESQKPDSDHRGDQSQHGPSETPRLDGPKPSLHERSLSLSWRHFTAANLILDTEVKNYVI